MIIIKNSITKIEVITNQIYNNNIFENILKKKKLQGFT